jgi:hypothetical protein
MAENDSLKGTPTSAHAIDEYLDRRGRNPLSACISSAKLQ